MKNLQSLVDKIETRSVMRERSWTWGSFLNFDPFEKKMYLTIPFVEMSLIIMLKKTTKIMSYTTKQCLELLFYVTDVMWSNFYNVNNA